jgi:hypothetical protein
MSYSLVSIFICVSSLLTVNLVPVFILVFTLLVFDIITLNVIVLPNCTLIFLKDCDHG